MITLNNWATQAHQKLDSEKGSVQGRNIGSNATGEYLPHRN